MFVSVYRCTSSGAEGAPAGVGEADRPVAVREEDHLEVAEVRVACGRLAAHVGRDARDDQRVDPEVAKQELEVGGEEGAVATLLEDVVGVGDVDLRVQLDTFGARLQRLPFGGQRVDVLDGPEVTAIGCGARGP